MKSLEDPYGDTIYYAHDKLGRLSTVTGSSFGGVTSYASDPHYRAWGGLQSLSYSNGTTMSMTFNNRLQADSFSLVKSGQQTPILSKTHSFYADGSVRRVDDLVDDRFDQLNTFDNVGRPKSSVSSFTARGETPNQQQIYDTPYEQSYEFNAFDNLTSRGHRHWNTQDQDVATTYLNNRVTNTGFEHDADGRETRTQREQVYESTYDAAGRLIVYNRNDVFEAERFYNGDGLEEKRAEKNYTETSPETWEWVNEPLKYFIRSTVLGGEVVSDVKAEVIVEAPVQGMRG